jgi:hypothetical protein
VCAVWWRAGGGRPAIGTPVIDAADDTSRAAVAALGLG